MTDGTRRNHLGSRLSELLGALERELNSAAPRHRRPGELLGLAGSLAPPPVAPRNALGGIFGTYPLPTMPQAAPTPAPVQRGVFFSFHYEDIRRTCIVRNSWRFRPGWSDPKDNFKDKSLWEKARSESDEALRRLIRKGMAGSSVTCVLAGTETWSRPYVRYEIAHSLFKRNGLFTVSIHDVNDPTHGYAAPGYDPLAFMGLELRADGKGRVCERIVDQWWHYGAMRMPVPWPRWLPKPEVGKLRPLNAGTRAYDYHFDQGHQNLPQWAQVAAEAAGRR